MGDIDRKVESPCIDNCCLNEDDTCLGCFRTLDEIKRWGASDSFERVSILHNAEQRRKAYEEKSLRIAPVQ